MNPIEQAQQLLDKRECPYWFEETLRTRIKVNDQDPLRYVFFRKRENNVRELNMPNVSGAVLVCMTESYLFYLEEGSDLSETEYGGFRMKTVPLDKISGIELDCLLLQGTFRIYAMGLEKPVIHTNFDRTSELENFIDMHRKLLALTS